MESGTNQGQELESGVHSKARSGAEANRHIAQTALCNGFLIYILSWANQWAAGGRHSDPTGRYFLHCLA